MRLNLVPLVARLIYQGTENPNCIFGGFGIFKGVPIPAEIGVKIASFVANTDLNLPKIVDDTASEHFDRPRKT